MLPTNRKKDERLFGLHGEIRHEIFEKELGRLEIELGLSSVGLIEGQRKEEKRVPGLLSGPIVLLTQG